MAVDHSLELTLQLPPDAGDEAALIAAALAGDGDAYADLVRPYERLAYRVAAAVAGSAPDGQEAVQNAYLKAHRSLGTFRRGAAFKPWLLRIVVNEAHNVRRAEKRHERLAVRAGDIHETALGGADESLVAQEEAATVLEALGRLPEPDRLVLALRYFADLRDREAAAFASVSEGAYRVRVLRALRRLRRVLEACDD